MSSPVEIENILPMSNIEGEKELGTPDAILNMDAFLQEVKKRGGYTQLAALTDCHSVYAVGSKFLCYATGVGNSRSLWKVDLEGTKVEIASLPDRGRIYYETVGDTVYISTRTYYATYAISTETLSSWGVLRPTEAPLITLIGGALAPGKYQLTFTRKDSTGEISGSGPIVKVELTATGGFSLSNLDSDYLIWITEANGTKFYYAGVSSKITKSQGVEVLQTLDVTPPLDLSLGNLCFFIGRIWGSKDNILYCSDPYAFNWFRTYHRWVYDSEIVMVLCDETGLYVGTRTASWYQEGKDIKNMKLKQIGEAVISGTGIKAPIHTANDFVGEAEKPIPVWATAHGIVAGIRTEAVRLTGEKLNFKMGGEGATFFRFLNGVPQLGVSSPDTQRFGISDTVDVQVFRKGRLIKGNYSDIIKTAFKLEEVVEAYFAFLLSNTISLTDLLNINISINNSAAETKTLTECLYVFVADLIYEDFSSDPGWSNLSNGEGSATVAGGVLTTVTTGSAGDGALSVTFTAQPEIWASFDITPSSVSVNSAGSAIIFQLDETGAPFVLGIGIINDSGTLKWIVKYQEEAGATIITIDPPVFPFSDGQKVIVTMYWKDVSGPAQDDGVAKIWFNSTLVLDVTDGDFDTVLDIGRIIVGPRSATTTFASSIIYDNILVGTVGEPPC